MKKIKKAVIPAAGFGTRFLPFTKAVPKELLPVIDKPVISFIVDEITKSGIEDILIITSRNKDNILDYFDNNPELERALEKSGKLEELENIRKIVESCHILNIKQHELKGLGHAVLQAKSFIGDEPFALLLGDELMISETPVLKQMLDLYEKTGSMVLGAQEVEEDQVNRYGIVDYQDEGELKRVIDLVEKPEISQAPSNLALIGRYILEPEIFDLLEETKPGVGGEIQLTDALRKLNKKSKMYALNLDSKRYDMGSKQGFLKATVEMGLRRDDLKDEFKDYLIELVSNL